MKANEIKNISNTSMLAIFSERQHYKFLMQLGQVFPTTKNQAKYYLRNGIVLDVLCMGDVEKIEQLFERNGYAGQAEYRYTRAKRFVRLNNQDLFRKCLEKEYGI